MIDLSYFLTAAQAVVETVLVALPGYYLTKHGALSQKSIREISSLNLKILTPCLLFTKIVQSANLAMLMRLWIEPLTYMIYTAVGLGFAWSMAKKFKLGYFYSRLVEVSVMFNNCNTLPYALIYSIATSPSSSFLLRDENDTPEALGLRGITYAVVFGLVNNIMRWSLGMVWLQPPSRPSSSAASITSSVEEEATAAAMTFGQDNNCEANQTESSPLLSYAPGFTTTPSAATGTNVREGRWIYSQSTPHHSYYSCLSGLKSSIASCVKGTIEMLLSPPIFCLLLGLVVIAIPPLQHLVSDRTSPFHSLWAALNMISDTAIPVTIITLGAQLGLPTDEGSNDKERCYNEETQNYQSVIVASPAESNTAAHSPSTSAVCTQGLSLNNSGEQTPLDVMSQLPPSTATTAMCGGHHHLRSFTKTKKAGSITAASITSTTDTKVIVTKRDRTVGIAIILIGRYLVVPTFAVVCLVLTKYLWPASTILEQFSSDPILLLVLLILSACPPAVNLIMITQSLGMMEQESAEILMWSYLSAIFVLAIEMSGFLWLTRVITGH
ncbi:hypothetical protein H4219_004978 [Mycoemilia scoparia]|uniref:Auxin efflux carrier n=1 Tax=Mycoemilia scoparia TaxID=417184 RepID=A0A9W7ZPS5_9FUNG|nr:hypothetical protein H4219_004978 [Mycoemilia scoparia]